MVEYPRAYRLDSESDIAFVGLVDFFGCAFVVKERDHVVFDIFVQAMPTWLKLFCKLFVAAVIVCAMIWSLGPVWDAIFGSRLNGIKENSDSEDSNNR